MVLGDEGKIKWTCVTCVYQFPTVNANIVYYKHITIKYFLIKQENYPGTGQSL